MAAYRTKVTVVTMGKEYPPGSILPADISSLDLAFLKEKGFIELADVPEAVLKEDEVNPDEVKSVDEIGRIRSKKELFDYATSIGLELGEWKEKSLKNLQEEVINYQEEHAGETNVEENEEF